MNKATRDDLASLLAIKLQSVIEEYHLKIIPVNDEEALIVGLNYALRFSVDRDGIEDVEYIERDHQSRLVAYTLRQLFMQRATPDDSANFGHPMTMKDRRIASLNVYSSWLIHRCRDVLAGDRSWQRESWCERGTSPVIEHLLQGELSKTQR